MAHQLVELSFEELDKKITGSLAEPYAKEILSGVTSYGKGDEVFALRGSRSAREVRQRLAGELVTRAASPVPVVAPTATRSSTPIATPAPAPAGVPSSSVASLDERRNSTILENANKHVAKVTSKGTPTSSGGSIMDNANAFVGRQRAVREQRERSRSNQDPKGAA